MKIEFLFTNYAMRMVIVAIGRVIAVRCIQRTFHHTKQYTRLLMEQQTVLCGTAPPPNYVPSFTTKHHEEKQMK